MPTIRYSNNLVINRVDKFQQAVKNAGISYSNVIVRAVEYPTCFLFIAERNDNEYSNGSNFVISIFLKATADSPARFKSGAVRTTFTIEEAIAIAEKMAEDMDDEFCDIVMETQMDFSYKLQEVLKEFHSKCDVHDWLEGALEMALDEYYNECR